MPLKNKGGSLAKGNRPTKLDAVETTPTPTKDCTPTLWGLATVFPLRPHTPHFIQLEDGWYCYLAEFYLPRHVGTMETPHAD